MARARGSVGTGRKRVALPLFRRLLKRWHPEGIPWPCCLVYDRISRSEVFQRHYEEVADDIARRCPKGALLDIGTGPGWLLVKLHERAPELRLTGLDLSDAMVRRARENLAAAGLRRRVAVREGDAAALPFGDGSFDVVVSTGSLHHWKEPAAALEEVHRVLRPGGVALLYDLVRDTPASVRREAARRYGWLRVLLLWIHGFEEPFYDRRELTHLARGSPFGRGRTHFVGGLCCLALEKES